MAIRTEYQEKYYQTKKLERQKYFKDKYRKERNKRLTKAKKYYRLNRTMILAKARIYDTSFLGHIGGIHTPVKGYARDWSLPCCTYNEFKAWASRDEEYQRLHKAWAESGFSKALSPVVMRTVKKLGFVPTNLTWKVKGSYSWWNEDAELLKVLKKEVYDKQIEVRDGTPEQSKKVDDQLKTKRMRKR